MAKEITDKKERKEKKDKKEKKEKRASLDGVTKVKSDKKDKKDKKKRKSDVNGDVADALEKELQKSDAGEQEDATMVDAGGETVISVADADEARAQGALVPFAFPLADDQKELKRILKTVKKSAKTKTLRRGVKEVIKALRKSPSSAPSSSDTSNAPAIVIIAADISPIDVISHLPVMCEDNNIPYIFVTSRALLGEASATKRPTSVVMINRERNAKANVKDSDVEEFESAYKELLKLVNEASKSVRK